MPVLDETLPVDAHSTPIMDYNEDEDCVEDDEEYPDLGVDELESKSSDTTVNMNLLFIHRSLYEIVLLHSDYFIYSLTT